MQLCETWHPSGTLEPFDSFTMPIMRDGAGKYIPFYAPGDFLMEVADSGGGSPLVFTEFVERYEDDGDDIIGNQPGEGVEFLFSVDETIFLERFGNGESVEVTIVNKSIYPVVIDEVFLTTGALARGQYGEVVFASGFETGDATARSSAVP